MKAENIIQNDKIISLLLGIREIRGENKMKKRFIFLTLSIVILMSFIIFVPKRDAATFSDVNDTHWANSYITEMQNTNIINGYEDGTFKPEQEVKTGEFIKMICMNLAPHFEYKAPDPNSKNGTHWSRPYIFAMHKQILDARDYDDVRAESIITREEATALITKAYILKHRDVANLYFKDSEENMMLFSDENLVTDSETRLLISNSVEFGLIEGYPDGTFKPDGSLTRAEAAKLIYMALYR